MGCRSTDHVKPDTFTLIETFDKNMASCSKGLKAKSKLFHIFSGP